MTGSQPVDQDCTNYSGTVLILPGEDQAILNCLATGSLNLLAVPEQALPGRFRREWISCPPCSWT